MEPWKQGKIITHAIVSLTIIVTMHLLKYEEKLCTFLQIIAGKVFHLKYSIFSLLSASLQCCLVAWSSSSIVQGYQSTETLLQLRPARAPGIRRGGAGDWQSFVTHFKTLQNSFGKNGTLIWNTRYVKSNSCHWVRKTRESGTWKK